MKEKICPLTIIGGINAGSDYRNCKNVKCKKESCAWYDQHDSVCCLLSMTKHLHDITYQLANLNPDGLEMEVFADGDD